MRTFRSARQSSLHAAPFCNILVCYLPAPSPFTLSPPLLCFCRQRIAEHDPSTPLFLFWSAHTVHEPYEVPDADLAQFSFIDVPVRQYYAAMVHHLDALVAPVVDALKSKGMWENLLCVCFASSALGDHLLIHLRHSFPPHAHHAPPPTLSVAG